MAKKTGAQTSATSQSFIPLAVMLFTPLLVFGQAPVGGCTNNKNEERVKKKGLDLVFVLLVSKAASHASTPTTA